MRRLLLLGALLLAGCPQQPPPAPTPPATPRAISSPRAPLQLAQPTPPARRLGPTDLSKLSADDLTALMQELYRRADYPAAAVAGQWAALKGGEGRYDLACCLALSGKTDLAFYFLQEAAQLEGVDPGHAGRDGDLDLLRSDSRWPAVADYLAEMERFWAGKELVQTTLVLPRGYLVGKPIDVVVGLHGLGGNERFVDQHYQSLADELGVAFVGINGSVTLGPRAFRWSEDRERDEAHLQKALGSLRLRLTPGGVLLFGFSQGGEMAWQLAAARPDLYRGALAFSAGRQIESRLSEPEGGNSSQHFLFTAGAGEHADTLRCTRRGAEWCEKAGAEVKLKLYPGMNTHTFPPDFATRFGPWLKWALQSKPSSSTSKTRVALGGITPPAPRSP